MFNSETHQGKRQLYFIAGANLHQRRALVHTFHIMLGFNVILISLIFIMINFIIEHATIDSLNQVVQSPFSPEQ